MKCFKSYTLLLAVLITWNMTIHGQSVSIKEETLMLDTYGFQDPDPVPILVDNPKIFPYFKFYGYDQVSEKKPWKVVTLENDYIQVFVLPEVGGKIWGAIDKSTGEEFLYKNEVMKFRNIAMRGPWTSGGIEFNFGLIGHSPDTATPVDYVTKENVDGSVSCIVGAMDLTSRTNWGVEIRLEADKAYVETKAYWYNGTSVNQSYYNWMTAAAVVADDLEFIYPGNQYLEHNGTARPWPFDSEGRNTAFYKNNRYGGSKSKHVVGEYEDFFGGYYHDKKFGFGHWAPYEEMPGQKLWLWALSRSGGIWEDLLTDTDGQYMEFQAGRLFNQFSPSNAVNPITQANFDPYVMDRWREIWFPFKEIGGMVDATEDGVLNVKLEGNELYVGVNALQNLNKIIQILVNDKELYSERLDLKPMEIFSQTVTAKSSDKIEVKIQGSELNFVNDAERNRIKRPFDPNASAKLSETEQFYTDGWEAMKFRDYAKAHKLFSKLLELDPFHQDALVKLAELEFRRTNYEKALNHANTVLQLDTYNPDANYFAGLTYQALGDTINALESLGWAARDIKYRNAAFYKMAEIYLAKKNYDRAKMYAQKALDFNRYNLHAQYILALVSRKEKKTEEFNNHIETILEIDPLNQFALMEKMFMDSTSKVDLEIHNEFPEETLLELALQYFSYGLKDEALAVLGKGETVKNKLWIAHLSRNADNPKSNALLNELTQNPIDFVFPYRNETLPVLKWAAAQNGHWKLNYYLAQNYVAIGLEEEGKELLNSLGEQPDSDVFYRFRAEFMDENPYPQRLNDLKKALGLNPSNWRVWEEHIQFYLQHKKYEDAYVLSRKAYRKFPDHYSIGLSHAKASVNTDRHADVLKVLDKIQILPYEHATESRSIYERAHMAVAMEQYKKNRFAKAKEVLEKSKEWPENIGVGKPYDTDEREQDFLLAMTLEKMDKSQESKSLLENIVSHTQSSEQKNTMNHLYGLLAAKKLNDGSYEKVKEYLKGLIGENDSVGQLALKLEQSPNTTQNGDNIPLDVWELAQWSAQQVAP
ncbi:DUF5107 domain-containing protein [Ulvibacterium marinum]|uniref:DUF5107 domain-containing protein n=1 Tax=Ulvibacterium marinum TaxID=2419782 RepID=UPI0024958311|nr:DUF5107 domain-containing protein [Ulvibacterium marinum]